MNVAIAGTVNVTAANVYYAAATSFCSSGEDLTVCLNSFVKYFNCCKLDNVDRVYAQPNAVYDNVRMLSEICKLSRSADVTGF